MWMSLARCSKAYCSSQFDDMDDSLVVGIEGLARTELYQLLEVADASLRALVLRHGVLERARQTVELGQVAHDVGRVGEHPVDADLERLFEHRQPLALIGLGGGDGHIVVADRHRQDAKARGVGMRNQVAHGRHIDLERVDMKVGQAGVARQPFSQRLDAQRVVRRAGARQPPLAHQREWVLVVAPAHAQGGDGFIVVAAADLARLEQAGEQGVGGQAAGGSCHVVRLSEAPNGGNCHRGA